MSESQSEMPDAVDFDAAHARLRSCHTGQFDQGAEPSGVLHPFERRDALATAAAVTDVQAEQLARNATNLHAAYERARSRAGDLARQLAERMSQLDAARATIQDLRASVERLAGDDLESLRVELGVTRADRDAARRALGQARSAKSELEQRVHELREQVHTAAAAHYTGQADQLRESTDARTAINALLSEMTTVRAERDYWRSRALSMESQLNLHPAAAPLRWPRVPGQPGNTAGAVPGQPGDTARS